MRGRPGAAALVALAALAVAPAAAPAQPASIRPTMYGPWGLACPYPRARAATASCTIRYQWPGSQSGYGLEWDVFLDASGNSRVSTSGWSRATCRRITVSQEQGRAYRLTDENIQLWRMENHAERLLVAMLNHIPSFGDCAREGAASAAFPATLLDGQAADFTRALIAAETRLRGRGPDPNEGRTTTSNLGGVEITGPRDSLERLAPAAAELGWSVSWYSPYLTLSLPANYQPRQFDLLLQRMNSLGLRDLRVHLIGHYGYSRVER